MFNAPWIIEENAIIAYIYDLPRCIRFNKTHRATAIERIYKNLILMNLCGASTFLHIYSALFATAMNINAS